MKWRNIVPVVPAEAPAGREEPGPIATVGESLSTLVFMGPRFRGDDRERVWR